MDKEQFLKDLEDMPTGTRSRIKIGENENGLKFVRVENPKATMEDLKLFNAESEGFDEGYKEAVKEYIKWRNELYLKIKKLNTQIL
jgi:hypothetical protein